MIGAAAVIVESDDETTQQRHFFAARSFWVAIPLTGARIRNPESDRDA